MTGIPNLTHFDFKRGYQAYQKYEPRDSIYKTATFLVDYYWSKPHEVDKLADGMGVLLLNWNQAFYRYGSFNFKLLEEAIRSNMVELEKFRPRNIQSFLKADEPTIKNLFLAFLEALRINEGKNKNRKSPVAVAKALHLLAPSFMPLWDYKIANGYKCFYNPNPEQKYIDFAYKMKVLANQLQEHVSPECGRTFLKLIDEYNFAKYTKGLI